MKSNVDVLREILALVKEELNEVGAENGVGYTMPDGKHHVFIYVDNADDKIYVIEPNTVVDGAHEPIGGENYLAAYNDFAELVIGCEWCFEQFERDREISNDRLSTLLHNAIICLEEYGCDGEQLEIDLGITAEEYDVVMDDGTNYENEPVKHKIYGFSEVSSEGFYDGNESRTRLYSSKSECVNAAYERYCDAWRKLEEDGWIENGCDENLDVLLSKEEFSKALFNTGYVLIQLPISHFQFEFFEQEIELSNSKEERAPVVQNLINAVIAYASDNSWTDNDALDSLTALGVTYEDFCRAGLGSFVESYFFDEVAEKECSIDDQIKSAANLVSEGSVSNAKKDEIERE